MQEPIPVHVMEVMAGAVFQALPRGEIIRPVAAIGCDNATHGFMIMPRVRIPAIGIQDGVHQDQRRLEDLQSFRIFPSGQSFQKPQKTLRA
jgi:hypothetical protein